MDHCCPGTSDHLLLRPFRPVGRIHYRCRSVCHRYGGLYHPCCSCCSITGSGLCGWPHQSASSMDVRLFPLIRRRIRHLSHRRCSTSFCILCRHGICPVVVIMVPGRRAGWRRLYCPAHDECEKRKTLAACNAMVHRCPLLPQTMAVDHCRPCQPRDVSKSSYESEGGWVCLCHESCSAFRP